MPAQKRVDDLWHHRFFVADHAVEDRFTSSEASEEISAKLIFDRLEPSVGGAEGRALQCAKCFWINRQLILRRKFPSARVNLVRAQKGN